jgi:hypothetical protein
VRVTVPVARFTTTEANMNNVMDRGIVVKCVLHKRMTTPEILEAWPQLSEPFVKKWAARARQALKESNLDVAKIDVAALVADKPRSGRPKKFTSERDIRRLKGAIAKGRGKTLRGAARTMDCCPQTIKNYCTDLKIVPRRTRTFPPTQPRP